MSQLVHARLRVHELIYIINGFTNSSFIATAGCRDFLHSNCHRRANETRPILLFVGTPFDAHAHISRVLRFLSKKGSADVSVDVGGESEGIFAAVSANSMDATAGELNIRVQAQQLHTIIFVLVEYGLTILKTAEVTQRPSLRSRPSIGIVQTWHCLLFLLVTKAELTPPLFLSVLVSAISSRRSENVANTMAVANTTRRHSSQP